MDTNVVALLLSLSNKATPASAMHDNAVIILILISALSPTLAAVGAYLKAKAAVAGVKEVHLAINSRLDEWLKIERAKGNEEGLAQGRKEGSK